MKKIWTKEKCKEEASKYSSRKEFCKGNQSAYKIARKNKWLDDYVWFTNRFIWTYENCKNEAKKYSSRNEFQKNCKSAYNAALKNKWLDEFYGKSKRKRKDYWNYEKCFEEASKYSSRKEFCKGNQSAYQASLKNKWLDEFYKEKHNLNDPRCVYSYEFFITESIKAVYVGITYMWRIKIRDNEHRTRKDTVSSFSKKYNIPIPKVKILEKKITIESKNKEEEWLDKKYRKEGSWIILNKAKGGSLGSSRIWTYKTCKEEASKYSSRHEFCKGSKGAYLAAWKNKWLDEFYGKSNKRKKGYWTYKTCKEEAMRYFSRNKFKKGSMGAYLAALRNKWLDEFFPKSLS